MLKTAICKFLTNVNKIWFSIFVLIIMCSCGTTKLTATIHQPTDGSTSTITISTNTPISTDVKPNTNVEFKNEK